MDATARMAQRMEALSAMGFHRVDASPVPNEVVPVAGRRHRVTGSRPSMGTLVSVTAIHTSVDLAQEAVGSAFREMDRLVALLNRYDPGSAVSALNERGVLLGPPPEVSRVLQGALVCHRVSRGAFDPTVQPLVDRLRATRATTGAGPGAPPGLRAIADPPSRQEVLELLERVDAGAVEVGPRAIRLKKEGMGVTLDGIAKGYVVDRMAGLLSERGLTDFLVNAGGDVRAAGRREDGRSWRVGIQDPDKTGLFPDIVTLDGMAVATSGSYEIYFDPDRVHHHIVDSRNGSSPRQSRSVSVVAPTAMEADALATGVFLMDPEAGAAFIDSLPQCACLIIDRKGRQVRSARWRSAGESSTLTAQTP